MSKLLVGGSSLLEVDYSHHDGESYKHHAQAEGNKPWFFHDLCHRSIWRWTRPIDHTKKIVDI